MSLQMFQRAMVELTLAPEKARSLREGDATVLAGFELTERERERLCGVVGQRGISVSCSLSRGNRFEAIFQTFPMTCVLLKPALRALVDELWSGNRPGNYQLAGEDAAFVVLLQSKIAAGELSIPYVDEVFAYEMACMELTRQGRTEGATDGEAIVTFQHSPDELLPPLSQLKAPPADLPEGVYRVRVSLKDEQFRFEVMA